MSADLYRAMRLLIGADGDQSKIFALIVPGEPIAKARARVSRHRHFTPQRTTDAERDIAYSVLASRPPRFPGNVALGAVFYRSNRHRIDTDNLMKTVLDGITKSKAVWDDDSQVTAIVAVTEYDPGNPRTVIAIAAHSSTLARGESRLTHVCEGCGRRYRPHSPNVASRYCSRACRPKNALVCVDCGGPTSHRSVKRCRPCHDKSRAKRPFPEAALTEGAR